MNDISREAALAHFGVKGMRWGVRKQPTTTPSTTKPRMSNKKKAVIAGALLTGAAITIAVLDRSGKIPISPLTPLLDKIDSKAEDTLWNLNIPTPRMRREQDLWNEATVDLHLRKPGRPLFRDMSTKDPSRSRDGRPWSEMINEYRQTTSRGKQAVENLSDYDKAKKLMADFDADIRKAHQELTERARRSDPTYSPHTDPYTPPYEIQRLRGG